MFTKSPKFKVPHPGKLIGETLKELGISQYRFAKESGIDRSVLSGIIAGRRGVSAETACRLARTLGTDAQSWLNLQSLYDIAVAEEKNREAFAEIRILPQIEAFAV